MKLSISYKLEEWRESVEAETQRHIPKMERFLKKYSPDLIQLHGNIEKRARREEYLFTLNLSLPTGTLHATGEGDDVRACVKKTFSELETQVKKHMALLRKDFEWKRKRPRSQVKALA